MGHVTLWLGVAVKFKPVAWTTSEWLHHVNDRRGTIRAGVITGVYAGTSYLSFGTIHFLYGCFPAGGLPERLVPITKPTGSPGVHALPRASPMELPDVHGGHSPFVDFHETCQ